MWRSYPCVHLTVSRLHIVLTANCRRTTENILSTVKYPSRPAIYGSEILRPHMLHGNWCTCTAWEKSVDAHHFLDMSFAGKQRGVDVYVVFICKRKCTSACPVIFRTSSDSATPSLFHHLAVSQFGKCGAL